MKLNVDEQDEIDEDDMLIKSQGSWESYDSKSNYSEDDDFNQNKMIIGTVGY